MKTFREFILEVEDEDLLKRFARRKKVNLAIHDNGDLLDLEYIHREPFMGYYDEPPNRHTKGAGAKVMRAVAKVADRSGKKVKLFPANSTLRNKYYPQFGYRDADYDDEDYGIESDEMVREPQRYSKLTAQQRYQRAEDSKRRKAAKPNNMEETRRKMKEAERRFKEKMGRAPISNYERFKYFGDEKDSPGQKQFNFGKGKTTNE